MKHHDLPGRGWTVVLRRQPSRIVAGRPEGGYTDAYELVCCECGDDPDTDYRDVSSWLQQVRGPYLFAAGVEAYATHVRQYHAAQEMASQQTRTGLQVDEMTTNVESRRPRRGRRLIALGAELDPPKRLLARPPVPAEHDHRPHRAGGTRPAGP